MSHPSTAVNSFMVKNVQFYIIIVVTAVDDKHNFRANKQQMKNYKNYSTDLKISLRIHLLFSTGLVMVYNVSNRENRSTRWFVGC